MKRLTCFVIAGAAMASAWFTAATASAATLRVCAHGCPYTQVGDAVNAARDGDSVTVAEGTYRGGFAITKSLTLQGAGLIRTTIRGGGPVITVGTLDGSSEPTVTIRDVTITGGVTHSAFGDTIEALGGGVYVPPAADGAAQTTLTIIGSAITGNVAAPSSDIDAEGACGPIVDCR